MSAQLGCQSPLVFAKLEFDLRSQLEDTFSSPDPDPIQRLADELDGYVEWRMSGQHQLARTKRPPGMGGANPWMPISNFDSADPRASP